MGSAPHIICVNINNNYYYFPSFPLFQSKSQGNDSLKEDLAQTAVSAYQILGFSKFMSPPPPP